MNILLFKIGALGDLLMTTPLVRQVRRNFPGARIDYLAGESFARILAGNPHLDAVLTFPDRVYYRRDVPGLLRMVRGMRKRRYDVAFVLDKHWIFPLSAYFFRIPRRIGFDRMGREGILLTHKVRYGAIRHEVHYYLDLIAAVGTADYGDVSLDFAVTDDENRFADRFWARAGLQGRRVVCLAPGGGVNPGQELVLKRWPAVRWTTLARLLKERGDAVVLVGGPTDKNLEREILASVDVPTAVGASLGESAAILARANAAVCNDSGPMHLAAAVGCRVVSLFGPTDPRRLAPLSVGALLWYPGTCGPCYDIYGRFSACTREHACMHAIAPEAVLSGVIAVMEKSET